MPILQESFIKGGKKMEKTKYDTKKECSGNYFNQDPRQTILTMNAVYQEWLCTISTRVKESTRANYGMKMEKHILPEFGTMPITEIKTFHIHSFISEKIKSGLSARYVSDIVVLMKSIFKYANREYGYYDTMANIMLPKKKKSQINILNETQQQCLQNYIKMHPNRVTLGIAISEYTGVRIGELCALQWGDIDLQKKNINVSKTAQRIRNDSGEPKTKLIITDPKSISSLRTIPIPDCLIPMLHYFQGSSEQFVLSGTDQIVEPRTMQYQFRAVLKKANLPIVHFHALRHMFATNCIALGFDVKALSEILGHSSVEITLNRYVHSSIEQKRAYMERLSFPI